MRCCTTHRNQRFRTTIYLFLPLSLPPSLPPSLSWRHMRAADIMLSKFGAPVLIDCIYESELSPSDGEERGREGGREGGGEEGDTRGRLICCWPNLGRLC